MGCKVLLYFDFYRKYVLYRDGAAQYRTLRTCKDDDGACGNIDSYLPL